MQWYNEQVKRRENSVQINEICDAVWNRQVKVVKFHYKTKQKTLAERFYNNDDY